MLSSPSTRAFLLLWSLALVPVGSLPATPVINEIHYNNDVNYIANEFVEIHNPSLGPAIDLSGWQLTGGVEFTFPENSSLEAGSYVVVAENPTVLRAEFSSPPPELPVLGPYTGGLSGAGETIDLVNASGERVDRVSFDVDFPWPIAADGEGSSMELINPSLDNNLGSSWRSSNTDQALASPTPGQANNVFSPGPTQYSPG